MYTFRVNKITLMVIVGLLSVAAAAPAWALGGNTSDPPPAPTTPTPVITNTPQLTAFNPPGTGTCVQQYDDRFNSLAISSNSKNSDSLANAHSSAVADGVILIANMVMFGIQEVRAIAMGVAWEVGAVVMATGASVFALPVAVPGGGVAMGIAGGFDIVDAIVLTAQILTLAGEIAPLALNITSIDEGIEALAFDVQAQILQNQVNDIPNCNAIFSGTVQVTAGGLDIRGETIFHDKVSMAGDLAIGGDLTAAQVRATQGISAHGGAIWLGDPDGIHFSDGITLGGGALSGAGAGQPLAVTGHVDAIAIGNNANAAASGSVALGLNASAANQDAIAIGTSASATNTAAVALGSSASATNTSAVALGVSASSSGDSSVAIGNTASASNASAVALGVSSSSSGNSSIAIGNTASATNTSAVALGSSAASSGDSAIALGASSGATMFGSVALGVSASSTGVDAVAIGDLAIAMGLEDVVVGAFNTTDVGGNNTVVGNEIDIIGVGSSNNTVLGVGHQVTGSGNFVGGDPLTVVGSDNVFLGNNGAITGDSNVAFGNTVNVTGNRSIVIGDNASTTADDTTVLGTNAQANATGAAAFGQGAVASRTNQQVFGTRINTYTMPGITSDLSRSRQSGFLEVPTTDMSGNLATDGGVIFNALSQNQAGIAISMALGQPELDADETFGIAINMGAFQQSSAFGLAATGIVSRDAFGWGERVSFNAAFGFSTSERDFALSGNTRRAYGGRGGIQLSW